MLHTGIALTLTAALAVLDVAAGVVESLAGRHAFVVLHEADFARSGGSIVFETAGDARGTRAEAAAVDVAFRHRDTPARCVKFYRSGLGGEVRRGTGSERNEVDRTKAQLRLVTTVNKDG